MSANMSSVAELARFGYRQELKRSMSTVDLVVYGLVFMVPIAPWAIFGIVFTQAKGMVPLVYLIGLVAMIFTALSYAQMSRAFPIAGSVYSYVTYAIHPKIGFLAGWTILLDYLLIPTLLYVVAAESMSGIFPTVQKPLWIVAFLGFNTLINYLGISFTAIVNWIFLAAELVFVAIFAVMAIMAISRGRGGAAFSLTPLFNPAEFTPALAATALSIAVVSFLGFDGIATLSEEAKGGRRSAGTAMITGLFLVAAFFVTQTWLAAMLVPGRTEFPADETNNAFFNIIASISNSGWSIAFLVMNALAVGIANCVAAQSATSRLLFSMARDGRLPRWLSRVNPRTGVPDRAIFLVAAITLALGIFLVGKIAIITTLVNFGALVSFLLLHVSVIGWYVIQRHSDRVLLHWAVPAVGFAIIFYVLWNAETAAKVGGLIWLAVGVLVMLFYERKGAGVLLEHAATPPAGFPLGGPSGG